MTNDSEKFRDQSCNDYLMLYLECYSRRRSPRGDEYFRQVSVKWRLPGASQMIWGSGGYLCVVHASTSIVSPTRLRHEGYSCLEMSMTFSACAIRTCLVSPRLNCLKPVLAIVNPLLFNNKVEVCRVQIRFSQSSIFSLSECSSSNQSYRITELGSNYSGYGFNRAFR